MAPIAPPQTIRAQAKASRASSSSRNVQAVTGITASKDVVKAVLASPLTVPWPNIPRHLQTTVFNALPQLIPNEVADYHVSRTRCHTKKHQAARRAKRAIEKANSGPRSRDGDGNVDVDMENTDAAKSNVKIGQVTALESPVSAKPQILDHLVLGINEIIKSLETSISDLKLHILMIGDALNGQLGTRPVSKSKPKSNLLPTAPISPSSSLSPSPPPAPTSNVPSSLIFILIPLRSINPPTLVSPIPQYCATHNTLIYQHNQLSRIARTRLPSSQWDLIGVEREEVRVVPLGEVEGDMAGLVGLRRLACLGVRGSHPSSGVLHDLLPKSILHPPRHSITLPYPISSLQVHSTTSNQPLDSQNPDPSRAQTSLSTRPPNPTATAAVNQIHYAPLHIKGIHTTIPADGQAKKKARLEEVWRKRVEGKEKRRLERIKELRDEGRRGKKGRDRMIKGGGEGKGRKEGRTGDGKGKMPIAGGGM